MSELTREQIEETTRDLLSLFGVQNPRDIESRKRIIAIRKLALAALERGVWVSVSERLPDQTEVYITAFGNKGVWLSVFNIDKQRWFPCVAYDPTVTHWMPLPAAPVSYDELEFTTDQPISPATPQTDK
jgi:hypothetical protein